MIRQPEKVVSSSRQYVVFAYVFGDENNAIKPVVVTLPEDKPNTGASALWHYMSEDKLSMMENLVLTKEEFDSVEKLVPKEAHTDFFSDWEEGEKVSNSAALGNA